MQHEDVLIPHYGLLSEWFAPFWFRIICGFDKKGKGKGRELAIAPLTWADSRPAALHNLGSGVLAGNDTKWRSASSGAHCPNERMDFGPAISSYRQTHLCPGQPHKAFTPQCSPATCYQVLIATHLPTPEGWKA